MSGKYFPYYRATPHLRNPPQDYAADRHSAVERRYRLAEKRHRLNSFVEIYLNLAKWSRDKNVLII